VDLGKIERRRSAEIASNKDKEQRSRTAATPRPASESCPGLKLMWDASVGKYRARLAYADRIHELGYFPSREAAIDGGLAMRSKLEAEADE